MRLFPSVLPLLLLPFAGRIAQAAPVIVQEPRLALEIETILVEKDGGRSLGTQPLEVSAKRDEKLDLPIPWPESAGGPVSLHLDVSGKPAPPGESQVVALDAALTFGSGRTIHSSRNATLVEGGTTLFEVFADGAERLVLSIQGERVTRPVLLESTAAARVRFRLEVERIDGERSVPLETDELSSFLGEPVEYSFGRGAEGTAESLRLVLTLQHIDGDMAEVVADVSASLPGPAGPILMSRQDRVFATRGATSTVQAVTGDPPAGYRFRITPLW